MEGWLDAMHILRMGRSQIWTQQASPHEREGVGWARRQEWAWVGGDRGERLRRGESLSRAGRPEQRSKQQPGLGFVQGGPAGQWSGRGGIPCSQAEEAEEPRTSEGVQKVWSSLQGDHRTRVLESDRTGLRYWLTAVWLRAGLLIPTSVSLC